jgi:hypothetical protein
MTHLDPQATMRAIRSSPRFLDKDQVDVLVGGETSAKREAIGLSSTTTLPVSIRAI